MKALVLSGGGSRGAYQSGCWEAIHETGWRPDLVAGTSVGALNGIQIAADVPIEDMHGWWRDLRQKDLLRNRKDVFNVATWRGFFDASPLRNLIDREFDADRLRAGTHMLITAVCVETGEEVVWQSPHIEAHHLHASTALLPGIPPVEIDGLHYADGGHWNALPLRHALEAGATEIHVLLHDPMEPHAAPVPHGIRQMLRRQSDFTWHARQSAEWEVLQLRMALPKRHPRSLAKATIHWHAPEPPLETEILRFDPHHAQELIERGRDETRRRLTQTA